MIFQFLCTHTTDIAYLNGPLGWLQTNKFWWRICGQNVGECRLPSHLTSCHQPQCCEEPLEDGRKTKKKKRRSKYWQDILSMDNDTHLPSFLPSHSQYMGHMAFQMKEVKNIMLTLPWSHTSMNCKSSITSKPTITYATLNSSNLFTDRLSSLVNTFMSHHITQ